MALTGESGPPWWGLSAIAGAPPDGVWAQADRPVSYQQLGYEVDAVRGRLATWNLAPGSTVALQLPPSFTLLWWLFALWSEGATVLLLDTRMKPAESAAVLAQIRPRHRIGTTAAVPPLEPFVAKCDVTVETLDGAVARPELCLLQCSSGSTDRPKVTGRTSAAVLVDVERHAANPGMPARGERVFMLSPPTHGFGLVAGVLQCLRVGAIPVFPSRLRPEDLLRRACEADIHAILGIPMHFDLLGKAAPGAVPPSLRLAVSCGDVLAPAVRDRFESRFAVPVGQAYGMTEAGVIATDLTGELPAPAVGRLLPGVEAKTSDGELYLKLPRSPYVYTDRPGRYRDGWLRTFDRARIDPDTRVLSLLGRADSVCIIGGLKVDLTEVEDALRGHPDVTDALAFCQAGDGGADNDRPPVLAAHVATDGQLTGAELAAWCRERLSDFKVPRRWHIDADIPRTAAGKADRSLNSVQSTVELAGPTRRDIRTALWNLTSLGSTLTSADDESLDEAELGLESITLMWLIGHLEHQAGHPFATTTAPLAAQTVRAIHAHLNGDAG